MGTARSLVHPTRGRVGRTATLAQRAAATEGSRRGTFNAHSIPASRASPADRPTRRPEADDHRPRRLGGRASVRHRTARTDRRPASTDRPKSGQNPVDALVSALATCIGIDVVDILGKRRTPPERLVVDALRGAARGASATRGARSAHLHRRRRGDRDRCTPSAPWRWRSTKYCSVAATLAPGRRRRDDASS